MPNFCKYCGDPVSDGELFCDNCGKRIYTMWNGAGVLENRQEQLGGDASPHPALRAGICKL